jgi:hypothetical protein
VLIWEASIWDTVLCGQVPPGPSTAQPGRRSLAAARHRGPVRCLHRRAAAQLLCPRGHAISHRTAGVSKSTATGNRRGREAGYRKVLARADRAVLLALAGCAALMMLAYGMQHGPAPDLAVSALFVALFVLLDLSAIDVATHGTRWEMSLTNIVVAASFVVAAGTWQIPDVALAALISCGIRHVSDARRLLICLAAPVGAVAAASTAAAAVPDRVARGVLAGLVFTAAMLTAMAAATAITDRSPFTRLVLSRARLSGPQGMANVGFGVMAGLLAADRPVYALTAVLPTLVFLRSHLAVSARNDATSFLEQVVSVYRGDGSGRRSVVTGLAQTAHRLFGTDDVRLAVINLDGSLTEWQFDPADDSVSRTSGVELLSQWWLSTALRDDGVVQTGGRDGLAWATVRVGRPEHPRAVLLVQRPVTGTHPAPARPVAARSAWTPVTGPFTREELRVARLLAADARTLLADDPVTPARRRPLTVVDTDGVAAPSGWLRAQEVEEATATLLAEIRAGAGVPRIVSALHEVEQATAAVLGSAAP